MFLIIWYFMNLLFPDEFILPPGFSYIPEFISKDEEKKLLEDIQTIELTNMKFQQYVAKRKTASKETNQCFIVTKTFQCKKKFRSGLPDRNWNQN